MPRLFKAKSATNLNFITLMLLLNLTSALCSNNSSLVEASSSGVSNTTSSDNNSDSGDFFVTSSEAWLIFNIVLPLLFVFLNLLKLTFFNNCADTRDVPAKLYEFEDAFNNYSDHEKKDQPATLPETEMQIIILNDEKKVETNAPEAAHPVQPVDPMRIYLPTIPKFAAEEQRELNEKLTAKQQGLRTYGVGFIINLLSLIDIGATSYTDSFSIAAYSFLATATTCSVYATKQIVNHKKAKDHARVIGSSYFEFKNTPMTSALRYLNSIGFYENKGALQIPNGPNNEVPKLMIRANYRTP